MLEKLKILLKKQDSLEKTLFWVFLIIVLFASIASTIFTIYEQISLLTSIVCFITSISCATLAFVAVKTHTYSQCYVVMCLLLSCFLLPMLFFLCGGFNCGMSLYCLTALFLCSYCPSRSKWIVFFISLTCMEIAFILSKIYPEYVVKLDDNAAFIDVLVSFFITGVVSFAISSFALHFYRLEKSQRETTLSRLEFLSKRDAKTGLFNRSYITHFLESIVWPQKESYYMLLMDIDQFREINANYGHLFGDEVLCDISKILLQDRREQLGECCARMDGDLFMCLFKEEKEKEAYARAEKLREKISEHYFPKFPKAQISFSGGFIYCGGRQFTHFTQIIIKAEEILYLAKSHGQNTIRKG